MRCPRGGMRAEGPCWRSPAAASRLPRRVRPDGVGAVSGPHEEADALGHRRVEHAVTGTASRGCYRLRRVPGPFTVSSMAHGSPGFSPTSLGATHLLSRLYVEHLIHISCKIHLVASRTSIFCPKILCK